MADITLKVSPQPLKAKSAIIQNKIDAFEKNWSQASQLIRGTKGYWAGDASNSHQKIYQECQEDVKQIIRRLREHPRDLLSMAGIYEAAEKSAQEFAGSLPSDVIV